MPPLDSGSADVVTVIGTALATVVAGVVAIIGLIAPVWFAIGLGIASLAASAAAVLIAIKADATSRENNTVLQEMKQSVSSQADKVEATLKHGT